MIRGLRDLKSPFQRQEPAKATKTPFQGQLGPAGATKTPFQGQLSAAMATKTPFQGQLSAAMAPKTPFQAIETLDSAELIQNFCKCN